MQTDYVKLVEEITAKSACFDCRVYVDGACAKDSYARLPLFASSGSNETAVLQQLEQLCLQHPIQVADLFQKDGPAVRDFDQTAFGLACASKGAFFATEQFAFPKSCRNRSTIEFYEWSVVPLRAAMQESRQRFLSRPSLSPNEHWEALLKNAINPVLNLSHGRSAAKDDGSIG
jgi:hypothetical protein